MTFKIFLSLFNILLIHISPGLSIRGNFGAAAIKSQNDQQDSVASLPSEAAFFFDSKRISPKAFISPRQFDNDRTSRRNQFQISGIDELFGNNQNLQPGSPGFFSGAQPATLDDFGLQNQQPIDANSQFIPENNFGLFGGFQNQQQIPTNGNRPFGVQNQADDDLEQLLFNIQQNTPTFSTGTNNIQSNGFNGFGTPSFNQGRPPSTFTNFDNTGNTNQPGIPITFPEPSNNEPSLFTFRQNNRNQNQQFLPQNNFVRPNQNTQFGIQSFPTQNFISPNTFTRNPNTFSNNPSSFSNNPNIFSVNPNTLSNNPNTFSLNQNTFRLNPNTFSNNPNTFSNNPNTFILNPNTFSNNPNTFSNNPNTFSLNPNTFSNNPNTFSNNQNTFSLNPNTFSNNPNTFSNNPNAFNLDLNTFNNLPNSFNSFSKSQNPRPQFQPSSAPRPSFSGFPNTNSFNGFGISNNTPLQPGDPGFFSGGATNIQTQTFIPPSPGPCPKVPVVNDFQLELYTGRWYELERFFAPFQNGDCVTADYSLNPNCSISVVNSDVSENGVLNSLEGYAVSAGDPSKGSFNVKFPFEASSQFTSGPKDDQTGNYNVVATDYRNYAVVYSCSIIPGSKEDIKVELSWILGRRPQLQPNFLRNLKQWLQHIGIDSDRYAPTRQTNCPRA